MNERMNYLLIILFNYRRIMWIFIDFILVINDVNIYQCMYINRYKVYIDIKDRYYFRQDIKYIYDIRYRYI